MKFYNVNHQNLYNREVVESEIPNYATLQVHYGIEEGFSGKWEEVIKEKDLEKRKKKIDEMIDNLEKNKNKNGFFGKEDVVSVGNMNGFMLDDRDIYYAFFENLIKYEEFGKKLEKPYKSGQIIYRAIIDTVEQYEKKIMKKLTEYTFDAEKETFTYPSIKEQKGKGSGICVEQATVSHNLWLLAGIQSYRIYSLDCKSDNVSEEFKNDGHCFCVVEYDGKFRLFDTVLDRYALFEEDPIELLRNGKPLVHEKDGSKMIYYGASKVSNLTV